MTETLPRPPCCRNSALFTRSEEHTSELQSRPHLVCRLLLEKKNDVRHNAMGGIVTFRATFEGPDRRDPRPKRDMVRRVHRFASRTIGLTHQLMWFSAAHSSH